MRRLVLFVSGCAAVVLTAAAAYLALSPDKPEIASPAVIRGVEGIGGPFALTDHTGNRVSSAAMADKPTLMYFGYTFCPDVCPIDTANMVEAVDIMKGDGVAVRPVFVTVDPERDTPEALAEWVEVMHSDLVALTGSDDEIAATAEAFKVYYQKVNMPDSEADYLMNHTAFMYLMLEDRLVAIIRNGVSAEEIARGVREVLAVEGFAG